MKPPSFADQVVEYSSLLKGYARNLGANPSLTQDLVQETILRALVHADQFTAGTNLGGWLCTILRNCYFNELRLERRALSEANAEDDGVGAEQLWTVELCEIETLVATLPEAQREALSLVAVEGHSYEDAAAKAGCACGTMKSRVSRARSALVAAVESRSAASKDHLHEAA